MAAHPLPPEPDDAPALPAPQLTEDSATPARPAETDPFATFSEWASDADTAGYANL